MTRCLRKIYLRHESYIEVNSFRDSGPWLHGFVVPRPVLSGQKVMKGNMCGSRDVYLMVSREQKIVAEDGCGALGCIRRKLDSQPKRSTLSSFIHCLSVLINK